MEEREKHDAPEIRASSKFLSWLDNYWYHYKWHTLIALFFLTVLIVSLVQCAGNEKTDVTVTFGGNYTFSEPERKAFREALNVAVGEDYNGDKQKNVAFATYTVYTEAELEKQYTYRDKETGEEKKDLISLSGAKNHSREEFETMSTYVKTGDCALWFVSPYVYEQLNLGYLSISAVEGKEIRLGDTDFYRYYEAMQVLPPETLVVLTDSTFTGKDVKEAAKGVYDTIVGFRMPE